MDQQDLEDFVVMHEDVADDVDCSDGNDGGINDSLAPKDRESNEDTEDARETDMVEHQVKRTDIREKMHRARLSALKKQLAQLKVNRHPGYLRNQKRIEQEYHERLFINDIARAHEIELVEREYNQERKAAILEFEEKKTSLRESLIKDLERKRRMAVAGRDPIKLAGASGEGTTRQLRRRPNDLLPMTEKNPPASTKLNCLLDKTDIKTDLKALKKGKGKMPPASSPP